MRFLRSSLVAKSLGLLLIVPLAACANSPIGQQVERSIAADPRLTENASPDSPATPTVATEPSSPSSPAIADSAVDPSVDASDFEGDATTGSEGAADSSEDANTAPLSAQQFSDLDQAPEELRSYVEDLAQLGVLSPKAASSESSAADQARFAPNEAITRREFARWLVATNNQLFADRSDDRIRLSVSSQAAFTDVPTSDPDFAAIQGLAEAGLLSSSLSGDSAAVTFRPDAPLTRQDLLRWKVPLDLRQPMPTATVDAVQQTWGFQDTARIDPNALKAVLADYQNGDRANIRRAYGYTTLLQPQKAVTRAEAAAALWYFGYQDEGVSAADALQTDNAAANPAE